MKGEIKRLHGLICAAPTPYTASEQCIMPADVSIKDAVTSQRVPLYAPSTEALPPPSVPAAPTLAGLSYRDVAASGSSTSNTDGFKTVTYRSKTQAKTPPANIASATTVKHRRQPLIGVRNSSSLPVIAKKERMKALFVSRFSPEVTAEEVCKSLKEQLNLNKLACTRLKTKFNSYSSFHIAVTEDEFSLINDTGVWPAGCLIAPYFGKLSPDQVYTPSTLAAGVSETPVGTSANPAGDDGADGSCSAST
jgi:hypothetical protein